MIKKIVCFLLGHDVVKTIVERKVFKKYPLDSYYNHAEHCICYLKDGLVVEKVYDFHRVAAYRGMISCITMYNSGDFVKSDCKRCGKHLGTSKRLDV